jgi:hypothetical protein
LTANVPINHFTRVLGPPRHTRGLEQLVEFSYVHKFFQVQAVADTRGSVLRYAVTSKDPAFNPPIWPSEYHPKAVPTILSRPLGTFSFDDAVFMSHDDPVAPIGIHGTLGARRFQWVEAYYVGGPGGYRYYFIGVNDGGWLQDPSPPLVEALQNYGANIGLFENTDEGHEEVEEFIQMSNVRAYRKRAKPNTYGATAPHKWVGPDDFPGWFGTDMDEVPRLPGD